MVHIRSRKHSPKLPSRLRPSLLALAALSVPLASHAQNAAPAAQALPEVKVRATADVPYKAEKVDSPKYTQPLVDTPQTITVITKDVLQEQGAVSLTEALRNTPGITLQLGENGNTQSGDAISMRGFDAQGSIFVDNMRDLGTYTRDTFNTEQVEVVKGPTGADVGRGSAGGYVNMVTKAPLAENAFSASTSYGSADRHRVTADINRTLDIGAPGTSAMRLNLMKQGGGVAGRDWVKNESYGVAPSIAFGMNTPTRLTLSLLHLKQHNRPDGGVPTVGLPGYNVATSGTVTAAQAAAGMEAPAVNPKNFYGSLSDFDDVEANMFTARLEHDFSSKLKLRNTFRIGKSEQFRMTTSVIGATFTVPGDLSSYVVARNRGDGMNRNSDGGQGRIQTNDLIVNQTHLSAEFDTGGIQHTLGAGVELMVEKQNKQHLMDASGGTGLNGGTIPPANLYNPDPTFALINYNPRPNGAFDRGETKTVGLYVFDTLKFNERWQVSAGLRADKYKTKFNSFRLGGSSTTGGGGTTILPADTSVSLEADDTLISYKVGALYKPTVNSSVYALYSVAKRPPGGDNFAALTAAAGNANNPAADPQEATNIEVGGKWDVNNSLALSAAVFNTVNKNEFVTDIASGITAPIGKTRVRGIELGAVGQITREWQASAGLVYMDAEITRGNINPAANQNTDGGPLRFTPELSFTAWTTYRLPFGLTVGGGARYVSEMTRSNATNLAPASAGINQSDDYWVFDGMLAYEVNKNVNLQLNVYNLTDKHYVASFNNGGGRYTPGTPRSALLTANFRF